MDGGQRASETQGGHLTLTFSFVRIVVVANPTIRAIYEDGVWRPLQPLSLQEHEWVLLQVTRQSVVEETAGMLDGLSPDVVREIAEGQFLFIEDDLPRSLIQA